MKENGNMVDHDETDTNSEYEPEYEPETFQVANNKITLEVLSVVPPPLEFMSELHSKQQEISGRQVWCGSLLLSYLLCQMQEEQPEIFEGKRSVVNLLVVENASTVLLRFPLKDQQFPIVL